MGGRKRQVASRIEAEDTSSARYEIVEGDPLSARVVVENTSAIGRDDWQMIARVKGEMTCDEHAFHLVHELVVHEGDDEVFSRTYRAVDSARSRVGGRRAARRQRWRCIAAVAASPNVAATTTMPAAVVPASADAVPRISGTTISSVPRGAEHDRRAGVDVVREGPRAGATTTGNTAPQQRPTSAIRASAETTPGTQQQQQRRTDAGEAVIGISSHGSGCAGRR